MATAGSWPIPEEMESKGAYPRSLVEHAEAMPSAPQLQETGLGLDCPSIGFSVAAADQRLCRAQDALDLGFEL